MAALVDYPAVLFIVLIVILIAAVICGEAVSKRFAELPDDEREDFKVVQTATLTLLALIIGFSLSMAVGRYDQRKSRRGRGQRQRRWHPICARRSG